MESIQIIHQDDHILIVNKPEGLLSIVDGYNPTLPHIKQLLEPEFGPLWMVHSLDKETSGVMVLARTAEAHRVLNQQFMTREVSKGYICLVSPIPEWKIQKVALPLLTNTGRKHLTRVHHEKGKPAQSDFTVLDKHEAKNICLLECRIKTGYRHQIRAHLYSLGLGILGDPLYAPPQQKQPPQNFSRMMLHASAIGFIHPESQEPVRFKAKTPQSFFEVFEKATPTKWDTAV